MRALTAREMVLAAIARVAAEAGEPAPAPDDAVRWDQIGVDSVGRLLVVLAIEEAHDLALGDDASELPTVGELVALVAEKMAARPTALADRSANEI